MTNPRSHVIPNATVTPEMGGPWDGGAWAPVPSLDIDYFRPEGTAHHPLTRCKLLYDSDRFYGLFRVEDRYVRCVHTEFQSAVWEDSCVEVFLQPRPDRGYFNFEFNCGGALLASYVTDPTRIAGRVLGVTPLSPREGHSITIHHSQTGIVEPEITDECIWYLGFSIPLALLEAYVGTLGTLQGQEWRGNFYKCGNKTSLPHWASWSPLRERNFHAPWDFGVLRFEE